MRIYAGEAARWQGRVKIFWSLRDGYLFYGQFRRLKKYCNQASHMS